jgi:hypothetical protein
MHNLKIKRQKRWYMQQQDPFSTYLIENFGVVPHDLLYPFLVEFLSFVEIKPCTLKFKYMN